MSEWLLLPFPDASLPVANYSQAWQDIFVLSALSGLKAGRYLEIGAHDPIVNNNTYLLSSIFNWHGVSLDIDPSHLPKWAEFRPRDRFVVVDALRVDYPQLINNVFSMSTGRIDYLQLDLEPSENTLRALERLPLDRIRFSVITFETDAYTGSLEARRRSRDILNHHGYKLVAPDVGVIFEPVSSDLIAFEDWWVDPGVVNSEFIEMWNGLSGRPLPPQDVVFRR